MHKVYRNGDNTLAKVVEIVADTDQDIEDLPKKEIAPGSTCLIIANSNVYMLGSDLEWHLL